MTGSSDTTSGSVTFEDARGLVRAHLQQAGWPHKGTLHVTGDGAEDGEHYSIRVGAREWLVDGDRRFEDWESWGYLVSKATGSVSELAVFLNVEKFEAMTPVRSPGSAGTEVRYLDLPISTWSAVPDASADRFEDSTESLSARSPESLAAFVRRSLRTAVEDLWRYDSNAMFGSSEEARRGRVTKVAFEVWDGILLAACRSVAETIPVEVEFDTRSGLDSDMLTIRVSGISPRSGEQVEWSFATTCPLEDDVDEEQYSDLRLSGNSPSEALAAYRAGWAGSEGAPADTPIHDFLLAALREWRRQHVGPLLPPPSLRIRHCVRALLGGGDLSARYDAFVFAGERLDTYGDVVVGSSGETLMFYLPPPGLSTEQMEVYLRLRRDGLTYEVAREAATLLTGPGATPASTPLPEDPASAATSVRSDAWSVPEADPEGEVSFEDLEAWIRHRYASGDVLDEHSRALVVSYLEGGTILAIAAMRTEDAISGKRTVPVGTMTDGETFWGLHDAYYAREYGLSPDPELLERALRSSGVCPTPSREQLQSVSERLSLSAPTGPALEEQDSSLRPDPASPVDLDDLFR